jgi:hypothetical protein
MSEFIVLKINNTISGYYNNKQLVYTFIKCCLNCSFINKKDIIILEYYEINSNILDKTETYNFDSNFVNNTETNDFDSNIVNNTKTNNFDSNILNNTETNDYFDSNIVNNTETNDYFDSNIVNISNCIFNKNSYEKIKETSENNYSENLEDTYENFSESSNEEQLNDNEIFVSATDFLEKKKIQRNNYNNLLKVTQEKINVTSEINKLKLEKQKLEEQKTKYDYDIILYNKFKNNKINNQDFIIPELFENKFKLFNELENNNNLNFDNFIINYKETQLETSYYDLFENQEYAYKIVEPDDFFNDTINDIKDNLF